MQTKKSSQPPQKQRPKQQYTHVYNQLGPEIGKGYQGIVYQMKGDSKKVIKKIPLRKKSGQKIQKEKDIMQLAGDVHVGPKLYAFEIHDGYIYILMEKLIPIIPRQEDLMDVKTLFDRAIQHGIVTLDSSFGRTMGTGKLRLYDFGVADIVDSPEQALKRYKEEDYFLLFRTMYPVNGLAQLF